MVYTWFEKNNPTPGNNSVGSDQIIDGSVGFNELSTENKKFEVIVRFERDVLSSDVWDRAVYFANRDVKVLNVGLVADTVFGDIDTGNYATLSLINKGTTGGSNLEILSRIFDTIYDEFDFYLFDIVGGSANVDYGEVLTLKKAVGGIGTEIPGSALIIYFERRE